MSDDAKYGALRSHQARARNVALEQAAAPKKIVVADCYPGSGKTLMAAVYADTLLGLGLVDYVLVIAPRRSLCRQITKEFRNERRGLSMGLLTDPSKTLSQTSVFAETNVGYVTTFHALVDDKTKKTTKKLAALLRRMRGGKWLVIVDEPHHMAEREDETEPYASAWAEAARPLIDAAAHVLLMSGTLRRHDKQEISFITYETRERDGKIVRVPVRPDIQCSREQALLEKMILPTRFRLLDADVSWRDPRGTEHQTSLRDAKKRQLAEAVRIAIGDSGFREDALLEALDHFKNYRETEYRSRAIVICADKKAARAVHRFLREMGVDAVLAISRSAGVKDEDDGNTAIEMFRGDKSSPKGDVLVTVGMAHEGLDVPDCTHLIILRNNKSEPWMEQAINRVTRLNPDAKRPFTGERLEWDDQVAFVFLLDHETNRQFINRMNEEADNSAAMHGHRGIVAERKGWGPRSEPIDVIKRPTSEASPGDIPPNTEQAIVAEVDRRCPHLRALSFAARLATGREFGIAGADAAE